MANTFLSKTFGSAGTRTKYTISVWVKRGKLGVNESIISAGTGVNNSCQISFNSADDRLYWNSYSNNGANYDYFLNTTRRFRDTNAWYHIVCAFDSTQGTASNRQKIYINGVQETAFSTETYSSVNYADYAFNNILHEIGDDVANGSKFYNGLMSHFHGVDGTAYPASTFGSTDSSTGEWKINTSPSITMGTNGFTILKDGNTITDQSTNSNDFSLGGGTLTKTEDCPSNNFATLNALVNAPADTGSLSHGNNTYTTQNYSYNTRSTLGMTSGKFYWEMKVNNATAVKVGVCTSQYDSSLDTDSSTAHYGGAGGGGVYVLMSNSTTTWQSTFSDTSKATGSYTNAIASTSSSILMGAVDVDANKLWVGVDGVWMYSGNPATGANAQITFTNSSPDALHIMASHGDNSTSRSTQFNFGNGFFGTTQISSQGNNASGIGKFEYDVPTGYTALSTKGLNL